MSQLGMSGGSNMDGLGALLVAVAAGVVAVPLVARYMTGSWTEAAKWSAGVYGAAWLVSRPSPFPARQVSSPDLALFKKLGGWRL